MASEGARPVKITRDEMTAKIVGLGPCYERKSPGWTARMMTAAPERLSAKDVIRLSAGLVSDQDRLWLAFRLAPLTIVQRVARRAVLRAVEYAARALEPVLPAQAALLRALPADASLTSIENTARAAAAAAAAGWSAAEAAGWAAAEAAGWAADAGRAAAAAANAGWAAARAAAADADAERKEQIADFLADVAMSEAA